MNSLLDWKRYSKEWRVLFAKSNSTINHHQRYTRSEVAMHCTANDCWCILEDKIYNLTPYVSYHPGGTDVLEEVFGGDATKQFFENHAWINYEVLLEHCFMGNLQKD